MKAVTSAIGCAALALCLVPTGVAAQESAAATTELEGEQTSHLTGPIDRFGLLGDQQAEITAGTADDRATLAFAIGSWDLRPSQEGNAVTKGVESLNFIISTPLGGEGEANGSSFSDLTNGTTMTIRWGRFVMSARRDATLEAQAIEQRATQKCLDKTAATFGARLRALGASPDPQRVAALETERQGALNQCRDPDGGFGNLIQAYLPTEERDYLRGIFASAPYDLGVEATVGRTKFKYVDPLTLTELSDRKIEWSIKAFYNRYLLASKTALTFSAGYERGFKGADEEIFCPPNPTNVVVKCTEAAGAPPKKGESLLFSAGVRHQFSIGGKLRDLATAPLVTYDAVDDLFKVDVPVYFLPDKDGGLTGGLRFGYRSDTDKLSFSVFIGAAFSILP